MRWEFSLDVFKVALSMSYNVWCFSFQEPPIESHAWHLIIPPSSYPLIVLVIHLTLSSITIIASPWFSLALNHCLIPFGLYWRWLTVSCIQEAYFSLKCQFRVKAQQHICGAAADLEGGYLELDIGGVKVVRLHQWAVHWTFYHCHPAGILFIILMCWTMWACHILMQTPPHDPFHLF
jgi:hypothetical protein